MDIYYYVHLHSASMHQDDNSVFRFRSLPSDSIFCGLGFFTQKKLTSLNCSEYKLLINERIEYDFESSDLLVPYVAKLTFAGKAGRDPIGVYKKNYLVASESGLKWLREFGVKAAEVDKIDLDIETYFQEGNHLFWMPETHRKIFIKKFLKK